jgi:hypothetical protein
VLFLSSVVQEAVNKHKAKVADIEGKIKAKKKEGQRARSLCLFAACTCDSAWSSPFVSFCSFSDEALEAELAVEQAKIKDQIAKAEALRKEMDAKQAQLKAAKKQGL